MLSKQAVLQQLESVTTELAACHRELAQLLMAEKEGKVRSWVESNEDTVTSRDRWSDFHVLDHSLEVLRIKGEVLAHEATLRYLTLLLEHGSF